MLYTILCFIFRDPGPLPYGHFVHCLSYKNRSNVLSLKFSPLLFIKDNLFTTDEKGGSLCLQLHTTKYERGEPDDDQEDRTSLGQAVHGLRKRGGGHFHPGLRLSAGGEYLGQLAVQLGDIGQPVEIGLLCCLDWDPPFG